MCSIAWCHVSHRSKATALLTLIICRYDIFNMYVREYNKQFYSLFSGLEKDAEAVKNDLILSLMFWVRKEYTGQLARLGASGVQPPLFTSLLPLITLYKERIKSLMFGWFDKILERDTEKPPESIDGQLMTMAPIDLFEIVQQQISLVDESKFSTFLLEVAHASSTALVSN